MLDFVWNIVKTLATILGFVVGFLLLGKNYKLVNTAKDDNGRPLCNHSYGRLSDQN